MNNNITNVKSLLLYIKNSFEFNDDNWKEKAIDFIAFGMETIGCTASFEKKTEEITVENYRIPISTTVENIIEIGDEYNYEIPITNTNTLFSDCKCCVSTSIGKYAELNAGWIYFNFETGTINLHYFALPVDDEGLPMIPRNPFVFEALSWFVAAKLMLGGNKHHTLTSWREANEMWEKMYPRAQNSLNTPTPAYMRLMANAWTNAELRGTLYKYL